MGAHTLAPLVTRASGARGAPTSKQTGRPRAMPPAPDLAAALASFEARADPADAEQRAVGRGGGDGWRLPALARRLAARPHYPSPPP